MRLDLHGIKHENVQILVEDFILLNETPLYIITGNSERMKKIVIGILDDFKFKYMIKSHNLGEIIIL